MQQHEAAVELGESPEQTLHDFARDSRMDLIILGTNIRPGSHRLYLGPHVESIIDKAHCPVLS